ncbi:PTS sugar transporter subunit IIC [Vagococcus sp. BWB3-3]|uniref:Permease IIC component n=1 Tax=Vagococcus allomyrinae TaxID=2794353 RepID=A0A940PAV1_9ENTE|nr:PTS transporter subunit EIIC [Vagococcus allomyrinae]MBP1044467.1 PTS sugar transporter subunit IIC [Vagococcus allomyrinae]
MTEEKKFNVSKLNKFINKFSSNVFVQSIANGMLMILPITVVGSMSTLIGLIPNLPETLAKASSLGTMIASNLISVYVVIALSYALARERKGEIIPSIILSMACFFVLTPVSSFEIAEDKTVMAFDLTYLGSKGMFVGMIVALVVTWTFLKMVEKRITLRMPEAIPTKIAAQFEAIIPAAIIFFVGLAISVIFSTTAYGNIHDFIYTNLQTPLEAMGSSIWSVLLIMFISELLWFFGIHGGMVVSSIIAVLFTTQAYANMEAVANGEVATNIINSFFLDTYKGPRAIALACILVWASKSEKFKTIGKISFIPGIFGITEPMKFGIPMIMNIPIFIPLTLSAAVSVAIAYVATIIGFLPVVSINVPKMFPAFISGFIASGWRGLVVQLIQFVAVVALYWPFMKKMDKENLLLEQETVEVTADGH